MFLAIHQFVLILFITVTQITFYIQSVVVIVTTDRTTVNETDTELSLNISDEHDKQMEDWSDTRKYPQVLLSSHQELFIHKCGTDKMPNVTKVYGNSLRSRAFDYDIVQPMGVRKEYRQLTRNERIKLHNAFRKLKQNYISGTIDYTEYETMVLLHRKSSAPSAHGGCSFVCWHREFLYRLERALQSHDPEVTLAYWDSTLDRYLPNPRDSIIWTDEFFGNPVGHVQEGFAANWTLVPLDCKTKFGTLERNVLSYSHYLLYNDNTIRSFLQTELFKNLVTPFNKNFEIAHGGIHYYVGGNMRSLTCAPNDPVFFFHHAFVDYLYEEFRQKAQVSEESLEYPDCPSGHRYSDLMKPFVPHINGFGISNHYTQLYYRYEPRSVDCSTDSDCKSDYLWCDTPSKRCKSKIRKDGDCSRLSHNACSGCQTDETPACQDNVCRCVSSTSK